MSPELKTDAESTPKQAIRLPSSDKFKSLTRPLSAPDKKHGKPMNNPVLMGTRLNTEPMPFKARHHDKLPNKPQIRGSTSPQPNLSVPKYTQNLSANSYAQRPDLKHAGRHHARDIHPVQNSGVPQELRGLSASKNLLTTSQDSRNSQDHRYSQDHRTSQNSQPQVTMQSTPVKHHRENTDTARTNAIPEDPILSSAGPSATAGLSADNERSGHVTRMPCFVNDKLSRLKYAANSDGLFVGNDWYDWKRTTFRFQRHDVSGDAWKFTLYHQGVAQVSFVLNWANHMIFKAACDKHGSKATSIGDHGPPQSLKKLQLEPNNRRSDSDNTTIDVDIVEGLDVHKSTVTLKPQGLYVNNKKFKKFEWPHLSIIRTPASAFDIRVKYDLYYERHHLKLRLGRHEAAILDSAAQEHNVSTIEPQSSSDATNEFSSPPKPHTEPKAESSPKSQPHSNSSEQDSSIPPTLRTAIEEKKRKKLQNLSKPLPKPTARPRESVIAESNKHEEISPQAFYTKDETASAPSKPSSSPTPENGTSRTDPIVLVSPEKPSRRLRRRARPEVADLEEEAAPIEPTEEDFQILRDAGFHRVAHRFWDGRLMEVSVEDIARLNPRIYVNDNIIWFFLRWYLERLYLNDRRMFDKILLLNTFFYPEVRKGDSPKWVTKLPILSKHITVMPIHEAAHWSVAVIVGLDEALQEECTTKPTIVVLDSLGPAQNHQTFRKVVSVLRCVLKMHNKPQLTTRDYRSLRTTVPVQTNLTDCGVYLLHYVEQIFERPDVFLTQVSAAQDRTLDMGEFWREPELHTKRDDLKYRLKRLGSEDNSAEVEANQSDSDDDIEVVGMEQVKRKKRKVDSTSYEDPQSQATSDASNNGFAAKKSGRAHDESALQVKTDAKKGNTDSKVLESKPRKVKSHDQSPAATRNGTADKNEVQDLTDEPTGDRADGYSVPNSPVVNVPILESDRIPDTSLSRQQMRTREN